MSEDPIVLDQRRGMAAQKATEIRRRLAEVNADQIALRDRQAELEKILAMAEVSSWLEAAEKARYLIELFAATSSAQDPRRQRLIRSVLDDFRRLSGADGVTRLRTNQIASGPRETLRRRSFTLFQPSGSPGPAPGGRRSGWRFQRAG